MEIIGFIEIMETVVSHSQREGQNGGGDFVKSLSKVLLSSWFWIFYALSSAIKLNANIKREGVV